LRRTRYRFSSEIPTPVVSKEHKFVREKTSPSTSNFLPRRYFGRTCDFSPYSEGVVLLSQHVGCSEGFLVEKRREITEGYYGTEWMSEFFPPLHLKDGMD
jgi:hypothetical protein